MTQFGTAVRTYQATEGPKIRLELAACRWQETEAVPLMLSIYASYLMPYTSVTGDPTTKYAEQGTDHVGNGKYRRPDSVSSF